MSKRGKIEHRTLMERYFYTIDDFEFRGNLGGHFQ